MEVPSNASVTVLGSKTALTWEKMGNGILIDIPETMQNKPPCENAWVVKISKSY
jgi:hypothetical protein